MVILLAVVLTVLCLIVLALPFLRKGRERFPTGIDVRSSRRELYSELRLLDEERLLEHISESDYQKQTDEVKLRAAELVRQEQVEAQAAEAARAAARAKARPPTKPAPTPRRPERAP